MKTDENITISRNVLMRLIKRNRQLIYMNFFLVHLCAIRNIDLVFVADEVCSILKITPEQLEAARKKRYIRCGVFDHKFIYHAWFCWQSYSDGKRFFRKADNTSRNRQGARIHLLPI